MARNEKFYRCSRCDHRELRWMGRCPSCGEWNSMEEESAPASGEAGRRRRAPVGSGDSREDRGASSRPVPIQQVPQRSLTRMPVEPAEFARVLGGGVVPGSLVLLGGAPGVGKSTILTQLAGTMAGAGRTVVYLTAEESAAQVRARAQRLEAEKDGFLLLEQPVLEDVLPGLYENPPDLLIVDSIQTVLSREIDGASGGVSQIRMCGSLLADFARVSGTAVFLVGHVTKEGDLAGPRVLEHLVDTVLYFEPQDDGFVRMVRAFKNRFGRTGELAVMEMGPQGLRPVRDASALFLAGRQRGEAGSCVTAILSGSRPFLVEIQALMVQSQYGTPTRVVTGIDSKRVAQLAAILDSKGGVDALGKDLYVKVAGGLRLVDPAVDLPLVIAMTSSVEHRSLPADLVVFGEVGLTGELRAVSQIESRLEEAHAHGFTRALVATHDPARLPKLKGMEVRAVSTLRDGVHAAFSFGQERKAAP